MEKKKITFDSFIRGGITCLIIVGILMLINRLSGVLLPFFIAWLIAYMLYPIVKFFQFKLRLKSRILSIITTLLLVLLVSLGFFYLVIPPMIEEFGRMNQLIISYMSNGGGSNIPKSISDFIQNNIDLHAITRIFNEENLLLTIKETAPKIWGLIAESLNILFSIFSFFLIVLYVIFILLDYESISDGWVHLLPNKYRHFASTLASDLKKGMNKYFRGQALVALCLAILFSIGFLIIGFPMAIGLGLLIGTLSMIPYMHGLGLIPITILSILKAADTGEHFWVIIGSAIAVFVIVQIIQDTFLTPKIMGKITGLNPAVILLSLSVWGSLMGMLGMIIALPVTTLLIAYYQRFIIEKENIKYFRPKVSEYQTEEENKEKE